MMTLSAQELSQAVRRVRQSVGIGQHPGLGVLALEGPDVLAYLHNRVTSDVKQLTQDGQGQFSALLDRKAHLQAFYSLHRLTSQKVWLLMDRPSIPRAIDEIKKFQIIERFTHHDLSTSLAVIGIEGPKAPDLLQVALLQGTVLPLADCASIETTCGTVPVTLIRRSFSGEQGFCMVCPAEEATRLEQALLDPLPDVEKAHLDKAAWTVLRIEAGLPWMDVDMDTGTLFPETGLEQVAVSYTKGCYLGQETVARVKTYGAIQKALTGIVFPENTPLPPANTPCLVEGQAIGTFKSGCQSPTLGQTLVLAYLDKANRTPGKLLAFALPNGETPTGTVTSLPFYRNEASQADAKALVDEGLKYYAEGRTEAAVNRLREAIRQDPRNADAYESLGVILSKQDLYEEAIALMQDLVALEPDRIMAHTNLSVYYMKLGDKDKAEDEKAQAMVLSMKQAAQKMQGKKDEAEEQRKKEQLLKERIALFQQALKMAPEDPLANFGIGTSYLDLKEYLEAIVPLQKAVAGSPNHLDAYLALGKCYEATEARDAARQTYFQGLDIASKRGDRGKITEFTGRLNLLS